MTDTKLPTRADGGIDWDEVKFDPHGHYFFVYGEFRPSWSPLEFAQQVAAHERERCAKWHEEQAKALCLSQEDGASHVSELKENWHRENAAAIRNMET